MLEGIDEGRVAAWARESIPDLQPPLEFSLIQGGHSNLTYRVMDSEGASFVLRRPPLGRMLESAHDMGREYRVLSALGKTEVPVPKTYGLCEDPAVNGRPFYVMEWVEGTVPHAADALADAGPAECRSMGEHVVEVLAALHCVVPDEVGLGTLGRAEGYISRQLKRWAGQWEASKTQDLPEMDACLKLLHQDMPEQVSTAIVHGDYRLGNMLFRDARIAAVLDWELCTLGDPLADVAYLLNNWQEAGELDSEASPTALAGFPSRSEVMSRYESATGRCPESIDYYRAFSHWRLAAIAQGVYARYRAGSMAGQAIDLDDYYARIVSKARSALDLLENT